MAGSRWNGSSYTALATKKRWNGSSWIDLTIAKRWNGSTWVDLFTAPSPLLLGNVESSFSDSYSCNNPEGSCPTTDSQSDVVNYSCSGGTAPYSVVAVVSTGPSLTLTVNSSLNTITASTSVGRNASKTGEVKVTVTDAGLATADFYIPFSFSYTYTVDFLGPPFDPEYPPPEVQ